MIKLGSLLPDRFKKKEKVLDKKEVVKSDTWTHSTWSADLINHLLSGKPYIGKKEKLDDFNVPLTGFLKGKTNINSPNFKKGEIFSGFESNKYLITTDLDDKAFQPNWNGSNYDALDKSQNVGVLKPEYRDAKNFKFWKRVNIEGNKWGYVPITKPIEER